MNIIDVCIILLLILGAVLGFKRGLTKSLASSIGFVAVIVFAFLLKNPLSEFMYQNLPFFDFWGIFKGITVLNILLYEIVAFLILVSVFSIILKVVIFATSVFEKLLNMTIILGIPSKILGMVVGIIEYYVIVFACLFIISLPIFNFDFISGSKWRNQILNNTPILTTMSKDTINVFNEFSELQDKHKNSSSQKEFNTEAMDIFLKYKIITVDSAIELVNKEKISIDVSVLDKYKEV